MLKIVNRDRGMEGQRGGYWCPTRPTWSGGLRWICPSKKSWALAGGGGGGAGGTSESIRELPWLFMHGGWGFIFVVCSCGGRIILV